MEHTERDKLLRSSENRETSYFLFRVNNFLRNNKVPLTISVCACVGVLCLTAVQWGNSTEDANQSHSGVLQQSQNSTKGGGRRNGGSRSRTSNPTVKTNLGSVQGARNTSRDGREYFAFYGVPYAKPPVGELRFEPPQPPESWNGTRNGSYPLTHCPVLHRSTGQIGGEEDCLRLNIYTPKLPGTFTRVKLPVLIYYYGGAFQFGDANEFNPAYFMDEDVVIVIPHWRVNGLGFFSTGDDIVLGNNGLKDQVQVLRWVHEHITAFGGDPTRIVPMGESAGAFSTHCLLLYPESGNYISGVISLSEPQLLALPLHGIEKNPRKQALLMGEEQGCPTSGTMQEMVKCLKDLPVEDIVLSRVQFTPSIEVKSEKNPEPILPSGLMDMVVAGMGNKVPWLVGGTDAEMIRDSYKILTTAEEAQRINEDFDNFATELLILGPGKNEEDLKDILWDIRDFYFGNESISKDSLTRFNLTNMLSDRHYYHTTKTAGLFHANISDVYFYLVTKEGASNVSYIQQFMEDIEPPYGVSHADDIQYFFQWNRFDYIGTDSPLYEFSKLYVKFLVSFAAEGHPVNPDANGEEWPKVDPADNGRFWYNLDDVPKLIEPFTERLAFWDSVPFEVLFNITLPSL